MEKLQTKVRTQKNYIGNKLKIAYGKEYEKEAL